MPTAWDEKNPPLAFLLTFRTFGTWHHGDSRGSVDRRFHNAFGTLKIPPSGKLLALETSKQGSETFILDKAMRSIVQSTIRAVCVHRGYKLTALNVRSNHGHAVVSFHGPPEKIVEGFKSYSTRALRSAGLVDGSTRIWSRHCSTRYLYKESAVSAAEHYVLYYQDDEFPSFDEVLDGLV
jgi:REP element-mobilizing transposase RayT